MRLFNKVVLFIDEALPKRDDSNSNETDHYKIRFLHNLGHAMCMRVVLAGTAATAATMISEKNVSTTISRTDQGVSAWAQIIFLWPNTETFDVNSILSSDLLGRVENKDSSKLAEAIQRECPLLALFFSEVLKENNAGIDLRKVLVEIRRKLMHSKQTLDEIHIVWLMGAWLDGELRMPSTLRMQAPDLV